MSSQILNGDSLHVLKTLDANSVDLLCTDPPYGYSFMGKAWDKALPDIGIFKECLRVLKPGAFAFVMSAPRSDVCSRMAILLEDAGFVISFTPIYWTYASGFPKAMNIGKMVDKREGAERPVIGPATDAAKALDGSYGGFQPKPAVEIVIVAMKPLSEKTYVDQALKNGKGITWLDDCRVPLGDDFENRPQRQNSEAGIEGGGFKSDHEQPMFNSSGRFPANLLVSDDVLNDHSRFFSVDKWAQTLPFLAVPKASKGEKNRGVENSGGRAFQERKLAQCATCGNKGLRPGAGKQLTCGHTTIEYVSVQTESRGNNHPTVKPLKLMSYLITLGSRPGDVVLDPFLGSGTTAVAAKELGREYVGIEREAEYVEIAEARIGAVIPTLV